MNATIWTYIFNGLVPVDENRLTLVKKSHVRRKKDEKDKNNLPPWIDDKNS